jgi:tetratricopeptide (TPR) repeat protein
MSIMPGAAAKAIAAGSFALLVTSSSAFSFFECFIPEDLTGISQKKADELIRGCTQEIQRGSSNAGVVLINFRDRGRLYMFKGQFNLALADADKCITKWKADPDYVLNTLHAIGCHYLKANAYVKLRKYDEAISAYNKAIAVSRDEDEVGELIKAYYERIKTSTANGRYSDAIADYEAIVALHPDRPTGEGLVAALASAYGRVGDFRNAARIYSDVIRRDPGIADAYFSRGRFFTLQGDLQLARDDFDSALRLEPNDPEYRIARGTVQLALGNAETALGDFTEALNKAPNVNIYLQRAEAFRVRGDFNSSVEDLKKAIELDRNNASPYLRRALVRAEMRDLEGAVADFNTAIRLEPRNPALFTMRGVVHAARGSSDKALADYSSAIGLDPKDAQRYNMRAWALFKAGMAQDGLKDANHALALDPKSASALATRGHIYEALGKKTEAIADFKAALASAPSMADAQAALTRLNSQ